MYGIKSIIKIHTTTIGANKCLGSTNSILESKETQAIVDKVLVNLKNSQQKI
jgi:hypothetical protein